MSRVCMCMYVYVYGRVYVCMCVVRIPFQRARKGMERGREEWDGLVPPCLFFLSFFFYP